MSIKDIFGALHEEVINEGVNKEQKTSESEQSVLDIAAKDIEDAMLVNLEDMPVSWKKDGDKLIGTTKYTAKTTREADKQVEDLKKVLLKVSGDVAVKIGYKVARDGTVTLTLVEDLDEERLNESPEATKAEAKRYLDEKGYHNYLKGDYDKNRLAQKISGEESKFDKVKEAFKNKMKFDWSQSSNELKGTFKANTKTSGVFYKQVDLLDSIVDRIKDKLGVTANYDVSNNGIITLTVKPYSLSEEEVESDSKNIPQLEHVYWDKDHENAYYVVAVYPKDNKVSYWNQEGDRKQTSIDNFMRKYELSTNEDDYDLFEESSDKDLSEIASELKAYLTNGLKDKVYHWKDNGEEADETDLLEYSKYGLGINADKIKESDDLIRDLEDLVDKWENTGKYEVYVNFKDNVVEFSRERN